MAGDVRQGPRQFPQPPKPQAAAQPPQQPILFDTSTVEQLAEICKHYNLTQINIGNIAIINTRPDAFTAPEVKKVTDEEILHNPYAGMEQ